jgi:hypothetical protein
MLWLQTNLSARASILEANGRLNALVTIHEAVLRDVGHRGHPKADSRRKVRGQSAAILPRL